MEKSVYKINWRGIYLKRLIMKTTQPIIQLQLINKYLLLIYFFDKIFYLVL